MALERRLRTSCVPRPFLGSVFANWRCEWPGKEAKWEVVCKELVECIIHTAPFQCGTTLTEN